MTDVRAAALAAYEVGLCVVPPRDDGSKAPLVEWKRYEKTRPTLQQTEAWFGNGRTGMGVICGRVSGNVEMFEFDDPGAYEAFIDAATATGLGELVNRIEAGYCESTPNGGGHWLYRCDEMSGNTKLARRSKRPEEMEHENDKVKVLIETRGEGGFVITAPTYGTVHPTGKPYQLVQGGFDTIATITPEERRSLFELAASFDRMPKAEMPAPAHAVTAAGEVRPGDDFVARTSWADVLEPAGWSWVRDRGDGTTEWLRPGKRAGLSATTNHDGSDLLYVFSSSTPFEPERGYNRFSAYATLHHSGDFRAAASALAKEGYGQRQPDRRTSNLPPIDVAVAQNPNGTQPEPAPAVERHAGALVDWSTFWERDTSASDWLVEPFLARGRGHALYAPAKTGKTLFAEAVTAALATGRHVLNQPIGPAVDVVYFDMEMTEDDLYERLGDLGYGPDVDMSHLHYYVLPSLYPLDGALGGEEVMEIVRHHDAQLVVVDTTARATAGKENDADTMRAFYAHTGRPLKAEGRALLRIDHAGKDLERGQRGTSAKADDVDVVWKLTARDGGRYRLDATHRRMSWVPPHVELEQRDDPLRYITVEGSWPAGTIELAERLNSAGVPLDAGRPTARQMLSECRLEGGRNEVLAAALRYRKTLSPRLGDSGTAMFGTAGRDSHHHTASDLRGQ